MSCAKYYSKICFPRLFGSRYVHVFLIVIVAISVYLNSVTVPFVFDDHSFIVDNPAIRDLGSIFNAAELDALHFENADIRNNVKTRPVSYLSFAVNYLCNGIDVVGFHLVNIAIHAVNCLLIYFVLTAIQKTPFVLSNATTLPGGRTAGYFRWAALSVALIFAVHPVHTNAVTYIVQRMASLATMFYLLSCLLYLLGRCRSGSRRLFFLIAALGTTVTGMLTKEICFSVPAMICIMELLFFSGRLRERMAIVLPFLATLLLIPARIATVVVDESETFFDAVSSALHLVNLNNISPSDYLITQLTVMVAYMKLMLNPTGLNLDRDYPLYDSLLAPPVLVSVVILLMVIMVAFFYIRSSARHEGDRSIVKRMISFGIIWFFLTLSVESTIIPMSDLMVEYRLYLPSIGFITAIVCLLQLLWRPEQACRLPRSMVVHGLIAAAMITLAVLTVMRNSVWQDEIGFLADMAAKSPYKFRPAMTLAKELVNRGRFEEGVQRMKALQVRYPHLPETSYELGYAYLEIGWLDDAERELKRSLALNAGRVEIYLALARVYLMDRRFADADFVLSKALVLDPGNVAAINTIDGIRKRMMPIEKEMAEETETVNRNGV